MEAAYLGVPGVDALMFWGLVLAAFCTAFLGIVTGAAGGLILLTILALIFPPSVMIPLHTVVQMGAGTTRLIIMWRHIMRSTVLPFLIGAALGATAGAQIFVSLPTAILQGILGVFILIVVWMPSWGRVGSERYRFAFVGFGATFLGIFVSATGTLIAPFVASTAPDRRNHAATLAALMTLVHVSKLVAFGLLGVALSAYLPLMAAMIVGAMLANMIGVRVLNRMPERGFRMIFQVFLTCMALRFLWLAATSGELF